MTEPDLAFFVEVEVDPGTLWKWEHGKGIPMKLRGEELASLFANVGLAVNW